MISQRLGTSTLAWLVGSFDVVVGVVLLARPEQVTAAVSTNAQPATGWARLLGVRYLTQGAVELRWASAGVLAGSAGVDALHGLSMYALAAIQPRYRRPALVSASLATAGASVTALASRQLTSAPS